MTRDWKNFYLDNHIHHVTGTVQNWKQALLCPQITDLFYNDYLNLSASYSISTFGYVLMPEHFHLLIFSDSGNNILRFLHGLRRSISGKTRRLIELKKLQLYSFIDNSPIDTQSFYYKTAGKSEFRFWKEKPRVFPVNRITDIEQKLGYVHMNPVRRGLVKNPEDWIDSSARKYIMGGESIIPIGLLPQDVAGKMLPS